MRDGGSEPPIRRVSGLTSAREIAPHATSQEEKGRREKREGDRREGRGRGTLEKYRVSDSREEGE
jgi:hypothetical protein